MKRHVSIFFLAVLGVIFLAQPAAAQGQARHKNGELVNDRGTVYLIKNDQRYAFRTAGEFYSNGYDFDQVLAATAGDLGLPDAGILRARSGALVLDASDNKTYYLVYDSGVRQITDPVYLIFMGMGDRPYFSINLADYPRGKAIDSILENFAVPLPGSLINHNGAIYLITSQGRAPFPSAEVFRSYGYEFDMAFPANEADLKLTELSPLGWRDGTLVNDRGTIYLISGGKRYGFTSWSGFQNRGYRLSAVIAGDTSAYPNGELFD